MYFYIKRRRLNFNKTCNFKPRRNLFLISNTIRFTSACNTGNYHYHPCLALFYSFILLDLQKITNVIINAISPIMITAIPFPLSYSFTSRH